MTLEKVVELLQEKYEQAQKEVESMKYEKQREYNRIAQQRSRAKKKGGAE